MQSYVGVYKQLSENEHLVFENKSLTATVFKKQIQVKKMIGHETKEVPVSSFMVNIYLTNKRLMFLILRDVEAVALRKRGVPALSDIEGSWYEIPVSAIRSVDAVNTEVSRDRELKELAPSLASHETVSVVDIAYEGDRTSGNFREYMESMFDSQGLAKMFNLKEVVELANKVQILGEQNVSLVPKLKGMLV